MGPFGKGQQLSRENIEKPEKTSRSKEKKKDISIFGKKPFLKRKELREWLRSDEVWKIVKIPREERLDLAKKLFDPKKFGELIEPKEVKKVYKELKNFPIRSKEKYGIKSRGERLKILKLLEKKFLRK